MSARPKFAQVVFQTGPPQQMRDSYCMVLDDRVVYRDDALSFVTFDDEHHPVALIQPPIRLRPNTFDSVNDLLDRSVLVHEKGVRPAVCVTHGVTASMYHRDLDGNMVELRIDGFDESHDATRYRNGPEYAADSVGPAFASEAPVRARRDGASSETLCDRAWALTPELPDPMPILTSGSPG